MRKKGFTLIELLVVIAIIALLLSIVMPALRSVKEQAKKTVCLSHIKGLGSAVLVYAMNNNDKVIPVRDNAFVGAAFNPAARDFGLDHASEYFTYYHTPTHTGTNAGNSGLGYLWKEGLLDPGSDISFCPSFRSYFGGLNAESMKNSDGSSDHPNFCGKFSYGAPQNLLPEDEHMDWLNFRSTIGVRKLFHEKSGRGHKTVASACMQGKRAFLSDLWAASRPEWNSFWRTNSEDIPHRAGNAKAMNAWYLDGHAESAKMDDAWFSLPGTVGDGREAMYLSQDATWSLLFD